MSKYRRILNMSLLTLAVLSSSVFYSSTTYAQEKPRSLRQSEQVIKEQKEVVAKKADTLALTAQEIESLESKKQTLAQKLEEEKKIVEDLKRQIAEKKARIEAEQASAIQLDNVASPAVATTPVAQVVQTAPITGYRNAGYSPNAYAWGQCTWYVKNRRPDIGSYWGNANAWVWSAQASGYSTGSVPVAGAIGQENGIMHVVYVESVSGDMVNISEMNYAGGVGVVHYRTVPAYSFTYIY